MARLFTALTVTLLAIGPLLCQTITGRPVGTVSDQSKSGIPEPAS